MCIIFSPTGINSKCRTILIYCVVWILTQIWQQETRTSYYILILPYRFVFLTYYLLFLMYYFLVKIIVGSKRTPNRLIVFFVTWSWIDDISLCNIDNLYHKMYIYPTAVCITKAYAWCKLTRTTYTSNWMRYGLHEETQMKEICVL